jgi:transposase-like protein
MVKKGQKFRNYPYELKKEAIRLHIEEGWTYRRIMEHLGIPDRHRLKIWMKKYKLLGEFGLMDQRGRREEYIDQDRYVQKLRRENSMLKKCLKIWMQEVQPVSIQRSNR